MQWICSLGLATEDGNGSTYYAFFLNPILSVELFVLLQCFPFLSLSFLSKCKLDSLPFSFNDE